MIPGTTQTISIGTTLTGNFEDATNLVSFADGDTARCQFVTAGTGNISLDILSVFFERQPTVLTKHSRFQKDATNVDNATQDIDVGFPPKAVIVWSQCYNSNNTVNDHYNWSQGFSDGTSNASVVISSDDADAAADTATCHRYC